MKPYYENKFGKLYCGDSYEFTEELLQENKIDCMITDPPYEISVGGGNSFLTTSARKILNKDSNLKEISNGFDFSLLDIVSVNSNFNSFVFCSNKQIYKLLDWAIKKNYFTNVLVWNKTNSVPFCHSVWRSDIEYIIHIRKKGTIFNDCTAEIKRKCFTSTTIKDSIHPTVKPLELVSNYVKIGSNEGGIVFDPFGGSGTTALGAQQNKRQWILIEQEEKYCEYAASRLEEISGTNLDSLF